MMFERRVWSAWFERVSLPVPASGAEMIATCRSMTWTEIGSWTRPVASAWVRKRLSASRIAGVPMLSALTTTWAGIGPPGKAFWMRASVWRIGIDFG